MTWRLEIVHRTRYDYADAGAVVVQRGAGHADDRGRISWSSVPDSPPSPAASVRRYRDYWGTQVCEFDVLEPHT